MSQPGTYTHLQGAAIQLIRCDVTSSAEARAWDQHTLCISSPSAIPCSQRTSPCYKVACNVGAAGQKCRILPSRVEILKGQTGKQTCKGVCKHSGVTLSPSSPDYAVLTPCTDQLLSLWSCITSSHLNNHWQTHARDQSLLSALFPQGGDCCNLCMQWGPLGTLDQAPELESAGSTLHPWPRGWVLGSGI